MRNIYEEVMRSCAQYEKRGKVWKNYMEKVIKEENNMRS